ncbi:glycogen/starch synthase [Bacteroidales bacterium OttesenSCG-928-C03]|nr:glycogen/starch synthase [Bacteroidales bacterium OttesenSCG-928-E04]MDL2309294.1 glycogen/starch synthase [Bacteroidales bacterium OttesenSCG-928-C03]MDL2325999.1 glycogen/starch synthase [Bacteroidales bacterium OttesenSCG-928-A14]
MTKKKILYIAPEITPYLPESYISNICRFLPQGIQESENEIRTFMPKYGCINERKNLLHEVIRLSGQNIIIEDHDHPLIIKVASIQAVRMQIYFIDSEDFFKRKQIVYDEDGKFFEDNDSRAIFFAKGVIETVRKLTWNPDIIHCHGWISSLVPLFIKTIYKDNPLFQETKIITSVYNDHFKEKFSNGFSKKLKLTGIPTQGLKHFKSANYDSIIKTGIDFSDAVIIGHPEVKSSIHTYLKNYDRPVFTHPEAENYVQEYDSFYDEMMTKEPLWF